jgi:hypothetical protein
MSSLPIRTNETDAEWQAMLARIGKFNEENYGKKGPMPGTELPTPKPKPKGVGLPTLKPPPKGVELPTPKPQPKGKPLPPQPPTRTPDRNPKMVPIRRAAGGAAKVRKGMMTSEGVITNAMNKIRGK